MNTKPKTRGADHDKIRYLAISSVMAALIALMTAYIFHIPAGANGGYIHMGDSLIYIAAVLLPRPYAMAAAAIGGGVADLLTAPMWAPATVIIKMLITLPFTNKSEKIVTPRNIFASVIAYFISGICYFIANYILFGTLGVLIVSMANSLIQSGGSAIIFIIIGCAMDKADIKNRFFSERK